MTWEGRLLPCGMLPDQGADVFQVGFAEAWRQAREAAAGIRLPAKCASCSLRDQCRACAAMVRTESGELPKGTGLPLPDDPAYPSACHQLDEEILNRKA